MFLCRSALARSLHRLRHNTRSASALASAAVLDEPPAFAYLEGLPRPDPRYDETILAIPRAASGTNASAKERKQGRVPSIVFEQEDGQHGGNKRLISVRTNQIRKLVNHLGYSFFLSALRPGVRPEFESDEVVEKSGSCQEASSALRYGCTSKCYIHQSPSHALLKVEVPLVYRGDDVCPGLRKGASLNTIKRKVKYLCPADIVPPYIDVDLSEMDVGQKLVMGDLKVHPALKLLQSKDEPVCKIMGARVSDQRRK
ncbi:hypothetical protein BT93_I1258 [Corymbia citriodora subsp. variegata]|nr:hypothetical protein BT93_I1258 [Corymbia citriodora subsp. variegata]